jgi:uncharacterized protein (TIGR02996 family)
MSDDATLFRAIRERPDDDEPRRALAEWLAGQGKLLWADLIRTQCCLERLLDGDDDEPFRWRGAAEVFSLTPNLRAELLAPFAGVLTSAAPAYEQPDEAHLRHHFTFWVRRGLIEGLIIHGGLAANAFAQRAEAIAEQVPLRHLRLLPRSGQGVGMSNNYGFPDTVRSDALRTILDQEWTSHLETLDLRSLNLGEPGVRALMRSHHRLTLRRLYFDRNNIGQDDARTLRRLFGAALMLDVLNGEPEPEDGIPF